MKKTISLFSVALATLILIPNLNAADDKGKGAARPRIDAAQRVKGLTAKVALTPEQQEKIKGIYEKNDPQFKEILAKGADKLSDADKAKLRELKKSESDAVEAVLTTEQKSKLAGERSDKPVKKKGGAKTETPAPTEAK